MYHQFDRAEENFVTPEDFLGFYSFISMGIDSDALFELQLTSVWNLSDNTVSGMPFAGTSRKISAVNAREQYRNDHHRNLFGTDTQTPFGKKT